MQILLIQLSQSILYYTSTKNSEKVYNDSLKKGLSEEEALVEKNKVKINGAPFLKSGANMKFYESLLIFCLLYLLQCLEIKVWSSCKHILACCCYKLCILYKCKIIY